MKPMPTVSRRVLLRLQPHLLAEALCLSLRAMDLDAVVCPIPERRRAARDVQHFSVAVTTEPLPGEMRADDVVVLDDSGRPVRLVRNGTEQPCPAGDDLEAFLRLVSTLVVERGGHAEQVGASL